MAAKDGEGKVRPRVGIVGLTTCAGDQLSILDCEDQLVQMFEDFDIQFFLMASSVGDHEELKDFDVGIVEGCVGNDEHLHMLRTMREKSKILIAFGTCATDGGIPLGRERRGHDIAYETVYGGEKLDTVPYERVEPIDKFVDVDFYIRGCPVRQDDVIYYLNRLLNMPPRKNLVPRFGYHTRDKDIDRRSIVRYNPNKCILCRRCDTICRDALGIDALGMVGKGNDALVSTPFDKGFDENGCIQCGQCVSMCSVGALYLGSQAIKLINDMDTAKEKEWIMVLDSMVLASFIEKYDALVGVPPEEVERLVIDSLRKAGFKQVLMYERYINEMMDREKVTGAGKSLRLIPWCKGAMNYVDKHMTGRFDYDEAISPWGLIKEEFKDRKDVALCIASPCSALRTVSGFERILSAMDLVRLFRRLHIGVEFSDPDKGDYDGKDVNRRTVNKKVGRYKKATRSDLKAKYLSVGPDLGKELDRIEEGKRVDLHPCLMNCITGGGNYPTTNEELVAKRLDWLKRLWGEEK